MESFTPLYTIVYAIMNSMEKLRFGKEGYFHVLVFYTGYFIKEVENIFPRVPTRYRNSRGSFEELEIAWKSRKIQSHARQFIVLPNFHLCFYHCMETRKMFSIS